MSSEKKPSWLAENAWKVIITFICSSILTSIMGVGSSYVTGLFSSPHEIKELKQKHIADSIQNVKQDSAIKILTIWANQDYDTLYRISNKLRTIKTR